MYFGKKQQFDWTFALVVTDVVTCVLAQLFSIVCLPHYLELKKYAPWPAGIVYIALAVGMLRYFRLYSWPSFRKPLSTCLRLAFATLVATLIFAFVFRIFGRAWDERVWLWLGILFASTTLAVLIGRILLFVLMAKVLKVIQIERIAFIGDSLRLGRVLTALAQEMGEFHQPVGYFNKAPLEHEKFRSYRHLGEVSTLEKHLVEEDVTLLIVEETAVTAKEMEAIAESCGRAIVSLKVIPSIFDVWSSRLSFRTVAGIPLMGVFDLKHDRFHNQLIKRAVDILGAIVGLTLFAPIIAVLGVMIYLESPGPIFFRQRRAGLNGEPFEIIKLRSMKINAESNTGQVWAVENDPRRLRIGTFMRSWNLDELPQFWNVLKGDMSLVGPRPEMYDLVQDFRQTIRHYNLRHTLRPGLTGWAAVHGLRGNTSLEDRIEYDLFYIEHWSLALDIAIVFMTLRPPKNAY